MSAQFYYKTTKYLTPPDKNSADAKAYIMLFGQLSDKINDLRLLDGMISFEKAMGVQYDKNLVTIPDWWIYGPGAPGILPTGWSDNALERSNEMFTDGMKIVRIWHSMENAQNYVNLINSFESPFISAELDDALVESTSLPARYRAY